MAIWGDEIREREDRLIQLRIDGITGADARRLEEERWLNRDVKLPPDPGVYQEDIAPPGEQWFKIVMPSGRVGIVHFPDELCDMALLPNLWRRFHAKTRRALKII